MEDPDLLLDFDRLRLSSEGDPEFERELFSLFTEDTAARLAILDAALVAGDVATAAREAHTIKGSSANVGALRVNALAAELERRARSETAGGCGDLPARLREAFEQVRAFMRERFRE